MQKVYVLLRNDKQTGPYSLQEIIQFDLKPYDLIWIEGKSAGWYYPQEIGALHPYLAFLPQRTKVAAQHTTPEKNVFVSMPPSPIKREELQPSLQTETLMNASKESYMPFEPTSKNIEEEVYAQFRKSSEKESRPTMEALPISQKKKSRSAAVGIATILIVGGVFAASWVMNRHSSDEETASETITDAPVQNEIVTPAVAKTDNTKSTQNFSAPKQKQQQTKTTRKQTTVVANENPLQKGEQKIAANKPVTEPTDYDATTPPTKEEAPAVTKEETSSPAETTNAPQEKKKKLRDKIFDIFKKKPAEQTSEEAKPAETENGERRATRREDGANLSQMVSIRFEVPNDWMMGIKGAKATLVNRSSEKISKAVVDVLYYDDDNNLLQKKTINFSNVGDKDSKTISIPDHSSATRVDYNIVSVEGKPAA